MVGDRYGSYRIWMLVLLTIVIVSTVNAEKLSLTSSDLLKITSVDVVEKEFLKKDAVDFIVLSDDSFNRETLNIKQLEDRVKDSQVNYIELNQEISTLSQSIPYNVEQTLAPLVWNETVGANIDICIVDTGVTNHTDLEVITHHTVVGNSTEDIVGHGTAMAGIVAAQSNNQGIIGVAPNASIHSVKVMNGNTGTLYDLIQGVNWCINQSYDLVLMSVGMEEYSVILRDAISDAYANNNMLFFAGTGNDGDQNVLFPAAFEDVIAVGSIDDNEELSYFSTTGSEVELVAIGEDINSTSLNNSYNLISGTSLSSAHAAGVAALLWSYNDSLTNEEIRAKLRDDAKDLGPVGKDTDFGFGLIQVNLTFNDYTLVNEIYNYSIYNVSYYNTTNETLAFWLSEEGTIDEVNFTEGIYFVEENSSTVNENYYLNVSETGTLNLLSAQLDITDDGFHEDGSDADDGYGFEDEDFEINVAGVPSTILDGICYNYDTGDDDPGNPNFDFDYCVYASSDRNDDCQSSGINDAYLLACSEGLYTCMQSPTPTLTSYDHKIDTSSPGTKKLEVQWLLDCDDSSNAQGVGFEFYDYTIFEKRRALCDGTTNVIYEGYDSDDWIEYSSQSCSSTQICDTLADNDQTTIYDEDINPCRQKDGEVCTLDSDCLTGHFCVSGFCSNAQGAQCNGNITVLVENSQGGVVDDAYVSLNAINQGQVDQDGALVVEVAQQACGSAQTVDVYCSDQTTLCDSQSTTMDTLEDADSLQFTCDICSSESDLFVTEQSLSFDDSTSLTEVTVSVYATNIVASNVEVNYTYRCGSTFTSETKVIPSISTSGSYDTSSLVNLTSCDLVKAQVDPRNVVVESNELNNNVQAFYSIPVRITLDVDTGYSLVDSEITDFISEYAQVVSSNADVHVAVGRRLAPGISDGWGLRNNIIEYFGDLEGLPYNGLVGKRSGTVYVFGNELDGTLAAVRRLVEDRSTYLDERTVGGNDVVYLDRQNIDAISVFDYLHTDENQAQYRTNSAGFARIVGNVLERNTFTLAIKRVLTANDQTSLRLKHLNQEMSPEFRDFTNERPIVLVNPLFGNLFSMEELGVKLARDEKFNGQYIRDVWIGEQTGGPTTECENCPNYTYDDLIDYYWPALIGGVLQYANVSSVDYVGYSASGGTGSRSYEKWHNGKLNAGSYWDGDSWEEFDLPANFVDHMALIAPMGAFDTTGFLGFGGTPFTFIMKECYFRVGFLLDIDTRIDRSDVISAMSFCEPFLSVGLLLGEEGNTISNQFWTDIKDDVLDDNLNSNPTIVSLNKLLLLRGEQFPLNNDLIIPKNDLDSIFNNAVANKKYYAKIMNDHRNMQNKAGSISLISSFINDVEYTDEENDIYEVESN